jgi:uncharacterized protein (TIGR03067 family)
MCRLTTAAVVVLAGLTLAAPRPKDPPKKDPPVMGQWQLVQMDGAEADFMTMEFSADGTAARTDRSARPGYRWRYTTDTSASPARLDYLYDDKPPDRCIFKVDGDTLTVCYSLADKERPREFGQPRTRELVFKRVRPRD